MTRPTKTEIEKALLIGSPVTWTDQNGKHCEIRLSDARQRRLFTFLLAARVRQPTELPGQFIVGLAAAFESTSDPASADTPPASATLNAGPWRLQSIETDGFGGLNTWGGPAFQHAFDQESLLVEGPNGSGKSSLVGAILWALNGERPRDHDIGPPHEPKPVFAHDGRVIGQWPPIACYPPSPADVASSPSVRVRLSFSDPLGRIVNVERKLENGNIVTVIPPELSAIPPILMETGLFMPARLAGLRFDGRPGPPGNAVQKLTGLDEFVAIAALVDGLCHKSREYLSYKRKELSEARKQFQQALIDARTALAPVQMLVPEFTPINTGDKNGEMASFGKMLSDRATALSQEVSDDFAANFDPVNLAHQEQAKFAITSAKDALLSGIEALPSWKLLSEIALAITEETAEIVIQAISNAQEKAATALKFLAESKKDHKFHLKAVAAQWHLNHGSGMPDQCPLCEHSLLDAPGLVRELNELRFAGDLAARKFDDNMNAIGVDLDSSLPPPTRKFIQANNFLLQPTDSLIAEFRTVFTQNERYAKLVKFCALSEVALRDAPKGGVTNTEPTLVPGPTESVNQKIRRIEHLIALAAWFRNQSSKWLEWWRSLAYGEAQSVTVAPSQSTQPASPELITRESLSAHLSRISDALAKAEPFRVAAQSLRIAWQQGAEAARIEKELRQREAIAESLAPLKMLNSFAESTARDAIHSLSTRILSLHRQIHLTEHLKFRQAQFQKKQGMVIYGDVTSSLLTDASLIANTSWLRSLLWAFLFALREEALEQLHADPFPLLVYDDPQITFDSEHRHRWAQYVAGLQDPPSNAQVILATHDETFLELIKISGMQGRQAMIVSAGEELGHVGIFEGDALDRKWQEVQKTNTPKAGREYIGEVRIYVEGMLRLMLRGEDLTVMSALKGFVLGRSRDKIRELNAAGIAPWDRSEFNRLIITLSKDSAPIKHMEMSHHSSGSYLGIGEAENVRSHWTTLLRPALESAFRVVREHHHLHGGLKALHAPAPTAVLPDGHRQAVSAVRFEIAGHASALSDGQLADGRFDLELQSNRKKIVLAQHLAFRLGALTLEPVAQPGDLLLVKDSGEPSPKSLVIALHEDRILARRFEIADNQSDVAVLTAHAVNPRQIAPPVIAHKSTLTLHKIIGVLYQNGNPSAASGAGIEACDCGGQSAFSSLTNKTLGLIKVLGHSAEPHALDGQYLIVKNEISIAADLVTLNGKPIIAVDKDHKQYFKRLRIMPMDLIVLESLHSGGAFEPIVLSTTGNESNSLSRVWPVVGVLFELPG